MAKTVTLELKSKPKKSQDFYTQIVRTIGLNSRFPLQIKSQRNLRLFCFCASEAKKPLPTHLWQGFALQTEQKDGEKIKETKTKRNIFSCTICSPMATQTKNGLHIL